MGLYSEVYQGGLLPVFFSGGSNPFRQWETHVKYGSIQRIMDPDINTLVTDILSTNVATTFITCPKGNQSLGIHLPFLVMIVKNLKKCFAFEVAIRDHTGAKRRFRVGNFQSCTRVNCTSTVMPIGLTEGWNQIQFNLYDFTRRAYNSHLAEVISIKINANIRLRLIYFTPRLMPEDELPKEYRLFYPLHQKTKSRQSKKPSATKIDENVPPENVIELIKQKDETKKKLSSDDSFDPERKIEALKKDSLTQVIYDDDNPAFRPMRGSKEESVLAESDTKKDLTTPVENADSTKKSQESFEKTEQTTEISLVKNELEPSHSQRPSITDEVLRINSSSTYISLSFQPVRLNSALLQKMSTANVIRSSKSKARNIFADTEGAGDTQEAEENIDNKEDEAADGNEYEETGQGAGEDV